MKKKRTDRTKKIIKALTILSSRNSDGIVKMRVVIISPIPARTRIENSTPMLVSWVRSGGFISVSYTMEKAISSDRRSRKTHQMAMMAAVMRTPNRPSVSVIVR